VARGLGPADYGNLAYLLGSFWAIRALLDMGSSSAFYTFIAQRDRGNYYYLVYFAWLAFQFLFSVALVALFLPSIVVERFWLGLGRELILLALLATFLQNQVWQTVVQMHEAERKTIKIQLAGLSIIVVHLFLVISMLVGQWLSIRAMLWAIVGEYAVAAVWLSVTLRRTVVVPEPVSVGEVVAGESLGSVIRAYFRYCHPMAVIAVFSFCYEMADRWLLQRYGGASQQGFYQVSAQLSTVSLLAASSIMNILWKEVAEANDRGAHERVAELYLKTTHSLVFLSSVVSCFLAPWAEALVDVLLGSAYHAAWPVLCMMLFYPIHQAVGQINGTLFMATGRNSAYMRITVTGLLVSIPVSYLLIAPASESGWGGLELGALGLAIKILGLNFLFVNVQSWVISRHYGIPLQWRSQMAVIVVLLALGYACRLSAGWLMELMGRGLDMPARVEVLIGMIGSGLVYLGGLCVVLTRLPGLVGMERAEVASVLGKVRRLVLPGKGKG